MTAEKRCACVSDDAAVCMARRYGKDPFAEDAEFCECDCHEPDEESFDV